ncbi:MAG TPA: hypothetical protein VFK17_01200 [Gaiellaceae bacterium]|nr:hypothetical protein [Gaiellaceae bacterium]
MSPAAARRARQHRIASLLDELEERRRHLYRLKARGARPAGLRDLKAELAETQGRLRETLAA